MQSSRYPLKSIIPKAFLELGGKFAISDDSHRVEEIQLNYHNVFQHIKQLDIHQLFIPQQKSINGPGQSLTRLYEIDELLASP